VIIQFKQGLLNIFSKLINFLMILFQALIHYFHLRISLFLCDFILLYLLLLIYQILELFLDYLIIFHLLFLKLLNFSFHFNDVCFPLTIFPLNKIIQICIHLPYCIFKICVILFNQKKETSPDLIQEKA